MSGLPVKVDLRIYRGDTWSQLFVFKDGNGDPIDLSGATLASWAWRHDGGYEDLEATTNGTPGRVKLAQATPLTAGNWQYDLEVTLPDGSVTTWVRGKLVVDQDITNAV